MENWVKLALRQYTDHSFVLHGAHANIVTRDSGDKELRWLVENTHRAGSAVNTTPVKERLVMLMKANASRSGFPGVSARFDAYSEPLYGSVSSWDDDSQSATATRDSRRSLLDRATSAEPPAIKPPWYTEKWVKWGAGLALAAGGLWLWKSGRLKRMFR